MNSVATKVCSKCGIQKPITDFAIRLEAKDGRRGQCNSCHNVVRQAYREKNKDAIAQKVKEYAFKNKSKIDAYKKEWAQSEKAKESRRQFRTVNRDKVLAQKKKSYQANKDRHLATAKKWAEKNAEKVAEYQKQYRKQNSKSAEWRERKRREQHIRRARKADNGLGYYSEQQVLDKYGTLCHICGIGIDLSAPRKPGVEGWQMALHIDHLIPIAKGGPDTLENVRPAHGVCNLRKWAN